MHVHPLSCSADTCYVKQNCRSEYNYTVVKGDDDKVAMIFS